MKKEWKEKWLKALRSGEYEQGTGCLRNKYNFVNEYCCLGVIGDLAVKEGLAIWTDTGWIKPKHSPKRADELLPKHFAESKFGISIVQQAKLARRNDRGDTFEEIANYIEENL